MSGIVERLRRELAPQHYSGSLEHRPASVRVDARDLAALLDVVEAAQAWERAPYGGDAREEDALLDALLRLDGAE